VRVTGPTLARHQLAFARKKLAEDRLEADLRHQDFFTYEPERRFAATSTMMDAPDHGTTAFRFFLELPTDWEPGHL
jgi:hypothetical protein